MLKRVLLLCTISLLLLQTTHAQQLNTDKWWQIFENTKDDSLRLIALTTLHNYYNRIEIDSNISFAKRLLQDCNQMNLPRYNALGPLYASFVYYRSGEFKKVQEQITKAASIAEKYNDAEVFARVENFRNIIETDPVKQIEHLRKAIAYKKALTVNDQLSNIFLANMTNTCLRANMVDSAFFYAQKVYEMSLKRNDSSSTILTSTMGNVYLRLNQPDIAYAFYKKGLKWAIQNDRQEDAATAYFSMANYFDKVGQPDSALYYWKKPFEYGTRNAFRSKLFVSKKIYEYYFKKGNNDSAAKYMNFYIIANDSINSTSKIVQLQAAKFEDELRQQEVEKAKAEDNESRNHNIQLAITAIGILTAVILFLLLSRSVLVSHKVVAFLSVLVLLVVFEFINLLIHPWLEKITHHSPILMLLGLVAIAALIIPLHHKLEHWTTQKLVEKNKAIRLANAKKTIEELEEKNTDNNNPTTIS